MNTTASRIGLAAAALVTVCATASAEVKVGDKVPSFSVTSMEGKQQFFKDLQSGPTFLYFIRDGDSVCQQETSYVNKMVAAYGGTRSTWYAVINAKLDRARSFKAEQSPVLRLVRDEDASAARAFGLTSGPAVIEIDNRGRVKNVWHGFSAVNLKEINSAFAAANRVPMKWMDFTKAPGVTMFGTDYATVTSNRIDRG